jgi:ribosomal protein L3 glutamine methyltransferase
MREAGRRSTVRGVQTARIPVMKKSTRRASPGRTGPPEAAHVGDLVSWAARRLARAPRHYGHGTDNPFDEAGALVFHALDIPHEEAGRAYGWAVDPDGARRAAELVDRRIRERVPAAYLTGRTWFAGHEILVTPDVLVPRSPIAELCESRFEPWVEPSRVRSVLDLGTGSGCIAVACAFAFPQAAVDAADVSHAALEVTARNIGMHGLGGRVRPVLSNVYRGLGDRRYDIIVSNPPYVSEAEMRQLPREYLREPRLGLAAGDDGLDVVRRILAGAGEHLARDGLLVVEVGDSAQAVQAAWPSVPFTWLEFERGGGGVFLLGASQVRRFRQQFRSA